MSNIEISNMNEEGDEARVEDRSSDAGIKSKLVTWLALAAFVVAAVAVTALAGSSVPSKLLREHPRLESEGRELQYRRVGTLSIWMDNEDDMVEFPWNFNLAMSSEGRFYYVNRQTRYVSKPRYQRSGELLDFKVSNLPASKGKTKLFNYVIDTDASAVTYTVGVFLVGNVRPRPKTTVYLSTFWYEQPTCDGVLFFYDPPCDCYLAETKGSKYIWECELDFDSVTSISLDVRAA